MDLIDKIYRAGIVGCGGAGFPTHKKYDAKVEYLIVNGAECEPLLRTDRYLMIHFADEIIEAAEEAGDSLSAEKICIALKETYVREIESLQSAIARRNSRVSIFKLNNFYPAGDEQMIVCDVTGKTVPPGGIPLDVNAVVSNVATMLCIYDAINGRNFTHKYLTVNGEVDNPVVLHVPIGTSFKKCIELAGGTSLDSFKVIAGGPMMGRILDKEAFENSFVTKTTSGLLVISDDSYLSRHDEISLKHMMNRAKSSCIQCSYCTQMCPRYLSGHPLQPHRIMRKLAYSASIEDMLDDDDVKQALICCECGICEMFACPMKLQPRRVNAMLKKEYADRGIRYKKGEGEYYKREEREYSLVPSRRIAARVGVGQYYDNLIDELIEYTPERVEIYLKQHIGAPANSLVSTGDKVKRGQLIGSCEKEKMGANIHASIDGIVIAIGERIVIEKQ
jgi:Na+-translocating ferredoxin:NAD+ oxidoreductase RnfC subunit